MVKAYRASILHFLADPDKTPLEDAYEYYADGLLLVTEWLSYRSPDFDRIHECLRTKVLFDGRNIWRRIFIEQTGLTYYGIGV